MPVVKTAKKPVEEPKKAEPNYISEKLGGILNSIGEKYGESLQTELMNRLERTISEFNDEVNELIGELRNRSIERRQQLHELWERRHSEAEEVEAEEAEPTTEPVREMSEWERRLELLEQKKS
ncbi:MAG: hypothetical protein ABIA75_06160 [Candidatus Neomarinimicrobiota bacterium]